MSAYLRNCLSFNPVGSSTGGGSVNGYSFYQGSPPGGGSYPQGTYPNIHYTADTGTKWIRIWANWHELQPSASYAPGGLTTAGPGPNYVTPSQALAALDDAVTLANYVGHKVILVSDGVPAWANSQNYAQYRQRDVDNKVWYYYYWQDDVSTTGPWGQWITWLLQRYTVAGRKIDAIEFINEPNLNYFPQRNTSSDRGDIARCLTANIFVAIQALLNAYAPTLIALGPGTSDSASTTNDYRTRYDTFTTDLAGLLKSFNFSDSRFIWTQHNYYDIRFDRGAGTYSGNSTLAAADSRARLVGNFSGFGGAQNPQLWLTEGGADRDKLGAAWPYPTGFAGVIPDTNNVYTEAQLDYIQAALIERAWIRVASDGGAGAGIGMFTNWKTYGKENTSQLNTGLLDAFTIPGQERRRTAYNSWQSLPGYA